MVPERIDEMQVKNAARKAIPFTIKSYTLPHETEENIEFVLGIYLEELGQGEWKNRLAYCLRELAVNAKKANTKRIYFKEKGLDINDPQHYEKGMRSFREETVTNIGYYLAKQEKAGLYIKVDFHAKGGALTISVRNNVEISRKEQMRIYDRIARSRAFESMEEAISTFMDDSEGAGLGIVILIMALKNIGLSEEAFDIDYDNGETIAQIIVPFSEVHKEKITAMTQLIVTQIDKLPHFPESIVTLQQMIDDPSSEITDIASKINMDPTLTADLLKLVNSPLFVLPKKVHGIVEAVKLLGLKGLKNQLYSYGTQKVLTTKMKGLWEHSYRTAFYASILAKSLKKKREFQEDVYVGGILHDMGKIIFSELHPSLLNQIDKLCKSKDLARDLLEDFAVGLNHAEIGGMIAKKWNFPPILVSGIRYHHEVDGAPAEFKDAVETIYLANLLVNLEEGKITAPQIDKGILSKFGITEEAQLQGLMKILKTAFTENMNK